MEKFLTYLSSLIKCGFLVLVHHSLFLPLKIQWIGVPGFIILTVPLLSEDQALYHLKSYIISKEQKHNEKKTQEHFLNPFINTK